MLLLQLLHTEKIITKTFSKEACLKSNFYFNWFYILLLTTFLIIKNGYLFNNSFNIMQNPVRCYSVKHFDNIINNRQNFVSFNNIFNRNTFLFKL